MERLSIGKTAYVFCSDWVANFHRRRGVKKMFKHNYLTLNTNVNSIKNIVVFMTYIHQPIHVDFTLKNKNIRVYTFANKMQVLNTKSTIALYYKLGKAFYECDKIITENLYGT